MMKKPLEKHVLDDIREGLGIIVNPGESSPYDSQLLLHMSAGLTALHQIGVVNDNAFEVDETTTWADIVTGNGKGLISMKSYLLGETRLRFDPPNNETLIEIIKSGNAEAFWRLQAMFKTTPTT